MRLRHRDAVWYPPDPDEPTSEIYRLMPPRRRPSELREALDAAPGHQASCLLPSARFGVCHRNGRFLNVIEDIDDHIDV